MGYREIIEEDNLDAIMERNVLYLDQIAGQMKQGDISVFAGAGLSVASGYVDWKKLLEPISKQLRLNATREAVRDTSKLKSALYVSLCLRKPYKCAVAAAILFFAVLLASYVKE